jgi:hypothetical protein
MKIHETLRRFTSLTAALLLVSVSVGQALTPGQASASLLNDRSLKISSSANGALTNGQAAGEGANGQASRHEFKFLISTTGNIGSIEIQYCDSAVGTCSQTGIPGFSAAALVAGSTPTQTVTGGSFTVDTAANAPTASRVRLTRTAASSTAADSYTIRLDDIVNPFNGVGQPNSEDNQTFYARIKTYSAASGYAGVAVDSGVVTASTAEEILVRGYVAETLNFCVGTTLAGVGCTTGTISGGVCITGSICGSDLLLGEPATCSPDCGILNTANAAYNRGKSYFRLSTNAFRGVVVSYSADTLKSGTNSIPSVGSTESDFGVAPNGTTDRFGLALKTVGDPDHSFLGLTASTSYDEAQINKYALDTTSVATPVTIASAPANTIIDGWQTGTVEYRGDPKLSSVAGEYTTLATYIATVTY